MTMPVAPFQAHGQVSPACSSDPQIGWAEEWADFVSILQQEPALALALLLLFPLLLYVVMVRVFRAFVRGELGPAQPRPAPELDLDALAERVTEKMRRPPRLAADPDLQAVQAWQAGVGAWLESWHADVTTPEEVHRHVLDGRGPLRDEMRVLIGHTLMSYRWAPVSVPANDGRYHAVVYVRPR